MTWIVIYWVILQEIFKDNPFGEIQSLIFRILKLYSLKSLSFKVLKYPDLGAVTLTIGSLEPDNREQLPWPGHCYPDLGTVKPNYKEL